MEIARNDVGAFHVDIEIVYTASDNGKSRLHHLVRGMSMKVATLSIFILLSIGTLALIINEFIFDWGSSATLTFAALNVVGLATLAFTRWGMKKTRKT